MSGHSKWSTIKRQKGAVDIKRGQTFTKISNTITLAAKQGGSGDPNSNPRLRAVLEEARSVNMPKENIQRAIDRGLGKLPGQNIEEVTFEGFGPGKVAFYAEGITDNKNRTYQEIRSMFEKAGGNLGGQGSAAYMFDKRGELKVKGKGGEKQEEMLELIDLGAEDVESFDCFGFAQYKFAQGHDIQKYLVYTPSSELNTMGTKITQAGYEIESKELTMTPTNLQEITDKEIAKRVVDFAGSLEAHDDIQKVYTNLDIPDEILQSL